MEDSTAPNKRQRYDTAFRAGALRLAAESRSTQAAARAISAPNEFISGRGNSLTPVAATHGAEVDPATATRLYGLLISDKYRN